LFGYFGLSLYSTLKKISTMNMDITILMSSIVEYYSEVILKVLNYIT